MKPIGPADIDQLLRYMRATLTLESLELAPEFRYGHLTLGLIDAVFSIGITYRATQRVVASYAHRQGLAPFRSDDGVWPLREQQEPITALIKVSEALGPDGMARDVFQNRCRTSTRNGILKAEAVVRAARVLSEAGVNYFQDLSQIVRRPEVEQAFRSIPGQGPGTSWSYLWMLIGEEDLIKPDRHVLRYISRAIGRPVTQPDVSLELVRSVPSLNGSFAKSFQGKG